MFHKIQQTSAFLRSKINFQPQVGIILGSGLGSLEEVIFQKTEIPYQEIPHFPKSTVAGHTGKLIFGELHGVGVMMMAGRFHYYEGYDMGAVTFPVSVMKALGVDLLMLSNAAGGMNPEFSIGDIMLINDHINLFPEHPLRGPNDERLGTRFPDMSEPYDPKLIATAKTVAETAGFSVKEGVYVGLQGPTFETRAEYKWLRTIGGDAVGMSTVPEVIVAVYSGMRVFAASVITDLGLQESLEKITHEEVLAAANEAAPKLMQLFSGLLQRS